VCPRCHALQPTRASFAPRATIERGASRLVIDARIGEGGMGVVWRAWRFRAGGGAPASSPPPEPVALKVLRPSARQTPAVQELFLREAAALQRLSHPNVVAYHDLFEHDGALVLDLEYVDGETLESTIARQLARARLAGGPGLPCLPLLRAWFYFQQLLGALGAVHAIGLVHRDVKPSNVLVRRDGLVKLGDFGIAGFAQAPRSEATSALELGTGAYMSPEQVLTKTLDGRSDLYSAAIVLYEMLSGQTPFGKDRSEFLVRKDQVDAAPPSIRSALPQAPPVLDALFARALAKDPAARFGSAIELGDAFRSGLGLPETVEWRAQADLARAAEALKGDVAGSAPVSSVPDGPRNRLATLRQQVARGYKTTKMPKV
jgi:serine/threonine-protein kinase